MFRLLSGLHLGLLQRPRSNCLLTGNQDLIYLDPTAALLNHFQTNQGHCVSCL